MFEHSSYDRLKNESLQNSALSGNLCHSIPLQMPLMTVSTHPVSFDHMSVHCMDFKNIQMCQPSFPSSSSPKDNYIYTIPQVKYSNQMEINYSSHDMPNLLVPSLKESTTYPQSNVSSAIDDSKIIKKQTNLKKIEKSTSISNKPKITRKSWTPEKLEILQRMLDEHMKISQISRILGMSLDAINRYRRKTRPDDIDGPPKEFIIKKKGRKQKANAEIEEMVKSLLASNNYITLKAIQNHLPPDIPKSLSTISAIIRRNPECKKIFAQMNLNRKFPSRAPTKKPITPGQTEISSSTFENHL